MLLGLVYLLAPLLLYPRPVDRVLADGSALRWRACEFETPFWRPVYCGRLRTSGSPTWELAVVYVPELSWWREDDPVLYLNGGPGASAFIGAEGIDFWLDWIDALGSRRDWYIYEQRGTGQGSPSLVCPGLFPAYEAQLRGREPRDALLRRVLDLSRTCFQRLAAEGWDLEALDTPLNADDALALMEASGRGPWNLFGSSYGTRLALELMRRDPGRFRAVVLDGVYPPEVNMRLEGPGLMQDALDRVAVWCAADPLCSVENPDFEAQYPVVFERLRSRPIEVRVRRPDEGGLLVRVDEAVLADVVFSALYWWESAEQVPNLFNELYHGREPDLLIDMSQEYVAYVLDESISDPVMIAVDCHDAGPVSRDDVLAVADRSPLFAHLYRESWPYDTCRVMPGDGTPDGFRQPVSSSLPTLLLSGELDPVTPPEWADRVARHLSHSYSLTLSGVGHGAVENARCVATVVGAFLRAPDEDPTGPCVDSR
ncbi:MAG: alpha/beta hydrolase [Gammaproteobacteria bacterium]